jgi:hypothetical protein
MRGFWSTYDKGARSSRPVQTIHQHHQQPPPAERRAGVSSFMRTTMATTKTKLADKPRSVSVADLTTHLSMQPRRKMDGAKVREYSEVYRADPDRLPAILVAQLTDQPALAMRMVVVDGHHRLQAARLARLVKVRARTITTTTAQAEWLAARENSAHGVPLRKGELREVFRRFVRAGEHQGSEGELMSYRDIQRILGRPKSTLQRWMQADFPHIAAHMAGEKVEAREEVEETDNAHVFEGHFWGAIEAVQRLAEALPGAERTAVAASSLNVQKTDKEREQRAAELTRAVLLKGLAEVAETVGKALGQDVAAVVTTALEERRKALEDGDF